MEDWIFYGIENGRMGSAIVPGIGISIGGGAKGEAALTAGYTKVIAQM